MQSNQTRGHGFYASVFSVLAALAGCATTGTPGPALPAGAAPPAEAGPTGSKLEFPIKTVNADGSAVPGEAIPRDLLLLIGAIPGSISGATRSIWGFPIAGAPSIALDWGSLDPELRTHAARAR